MTTYQSVIRSYSRTVGTGHADADLTPRQRRLTETLLNLASNAPLASVVYPPTDDTRERTIRYLSDVLWNAGASALVVATAPRADADYSVAQDRALTILRNI
jgi:hypothetical protein